MRSPPIFHTSAKVILKYKSEGFEGFPKQPYLSMYSVTTLLTVCVSYSGPLFSAESTLNSPHLQVLALAVPSTQNALSYKTLSSLAPERTSLTTLRFPLLVSIRVPAWDLHITFLDLSFICLPVVVFPHSTGSSPKARPLLSHTPLYSQSLAREPEDGTSSGTTC